MFSRSFSNINKQAAFKLLALGFVALGVFEAAVVLCSTWFALIWYDCPCLPSSHPMAKILDLAMELMFISVFMSALCAGISKRFAPKLERARS